MRKPYKTIKPLHKYMIDHDISWEDIERNVKVMLPVISSWQKDKWIIVKFEHIKALKDYLGCKYTDIFGYLI